MKGLEAVLQIMKSFKIRRRKGKKAEKRKGRETC